jgi:5-methylcytosine-specific restriction endonuclease McrA
MHASSLRKYLKHYGKITSLRMSNLESTVNRIIADFDTYDEKRVKDTIEENLGMKWDDLQCVYCDRPATCWDHLFAASKGGTHQLKNLAPCCTACNQLKGKMDWKDFIGPGIGPEQAARRARLENYTHAYEAGGIIVSESERLQLRKIMSRVRADLQKADVIVTKALVRRRLQKQEPGKGGVASRTIR